jgi:uncharacterized protein (DUF1778 family)
MRNDKNEKVIFLRLSPEEHERIKRAARLAEKSLNVWGVDALMEAADWELGEEEAEGVDEAIEGALDEIADGLIANSR